jgi:DNA-binding HxlR family transcriptional regulator
MSPSREASCRPEVCSLIRGIKSAGSPWNLIVAAYMLDGPRRFNEILNLGQGDSLNARTLSRALKHLVTQGFVKREILATQPFAVGYSLTSQGDKLRKLLEAYRGLDRLTVPRQQA